MNETTYRTGLNTYPLSLTKTTKGELVDLTARLYERATLAQRHALYDGATPEQRSAIDALAHLHRDADFSQLARSTHQLGYCTSFATVAARKAFNSAVSSRAASKETWRGIARTLAASLKDARDAARAARVAARKANS